MALEEAEAKVVELTAALDETKAEHALNVRDIFELIPTPTSTATLIPTLLSVISST